MVTWVRIRYIPCYHIIDQLRPPSLAAMLSPGD